MISENVNKPFNEDERNWMLAAGNRVMAFSQNGPLHIKINDRII